MNDTAVRPVRPYWLPDTQGFLAIAIIGVVAALSFLLLLSEIKFDDKVAGAFMTLLGVLTACLKDVYSFFFGSSRGSDKKDDVISAIASAPDPVKASAARPTAWWEKMTDLEKTVIGTNAKDDARLAAIMTAAASGTATADDLAYLVSKGVLSQDRATAIQVA